MRDTYLPTQHFCTELKLYTDQRKANVKATSSYKLISICYIIDKQTSSCAVNVGHKTLLCYLRQHLLEFLVMATFMLSESMTALSKKLNVNN